MSYLEIKPNAIFNNGEANDGVCRIKTAVINGIAVGANNLIVTGVAGKMIQVVGGFIFSNGAYTQVTFLDDTGGNPVAIYAIPVNTVATPNVQLVPTERDIFETAIGKGLYANNSAVVAIASIRYIEYTP